MLLVFGCPPRNEGDAHQSLGGGQPKAAIGSAKLEGEGIARAAVGAIATSGSWWGEYLRGSGSMLDC